MLLAKTNPDLGLRAHTQHVLQAAETFGDAYDVARQPLRLGALLHDAGKGHPFFQRRLRGESDSNYPHRHELSSLLFLPLIEKERWQGVVEAVLAHHKSAKGDPSERGILDLEETWGRDLLFQMHADDLEGAGGTWPEWHPLVIEEVLGPLSGGWDLEIATGPISPDEAQEAFEWAREFAAGAPERPSGLRGALMESDHFASAFRGQTRERARPLFGQADLSPFRSEDPAYPLSQKPIDRQTHTLVVAPTGAGKTYAMLRACSERVFYVLPYQASINAMARRIREKTEADVRRLHAASRTGAVPETRAKLQRFGGAAVKVMTPHQLASLIFGLEGYEKQRLDVQGTDVILDEVHVYNRHAKAMVLELAAELDRLGCRVHVGTATIPTALSEAIEDALGEVQEVTLTEEELRRYDRHVVHKASSWQEKVREAIEVGKSVLFVCNRVKGAQKRFAALRKEHGERLEDRLLLIHSRYRRGDRSRLEARVEELSGQDGPAICVATQVVEVSLDISFDVLVTDAAPLDSLIQRLGRVNRHVTEGRDLADVYVLPPPTSRGEALPYDLESIQKSHEVLPDGDVLSSTHTQAMIDQVFPEVDLADIAVELVRGPEGGWQLPALRHRPKATLLESLAIDSGSVVLESDAERYPDPDVEIPITARLSEELEEAGYQQIQARSYPHVVPDDWYDWDDSGQGKGLTRRSP